MAHTVGALQSAPIRRWSRMSPVKVLVPAAAVVSFLMAVDAPSALADGQAIVNAAQAIENAGYPYCFDGGTINGPTVGSTDSASDGEYSNCSQIGKVGFAPVAG